MKKEILLSLFLMAFSFSIHSQITITQSDMPQIGDIQATITANVTPGITVGSPGANQTWDFSDLEGIDTSISNFISTAGTPGESSFPTATLAIESGGDYTYVEINSNATLFLGGSADTSGMGDYFDLVFDPSQKVFELPTTYGTNYMDESGFRITTDGGSLGVDSIRLITSIIKNADFDGYGTVITPLGSFDGLREEVISANYDTIEVYLFGIWQTFQTDLTIDTSYSWYSKESKGSLVNIEIQDGNVFDVSFQDLEPTFNTPIASFSYIDQGQGTVDFTDQSTNLPTSWLWDFGDGNTSTMQNPSHTYASPGMYTVCLTVSNISGSDVVCLVLDISIDVIPVASFTYADQGQGAVDFTDQSTNQPTSWSWDFGDSNTSTEQNPSHTYASSGMYNVCLTATNSAGSDTNCQMLDIEVVVAPVAAFIYTDQGQGAIDFSDQSTNQPTSWEWDFGDGNTSIMQNPSHTYASTGMYNVCLTVSNIAGSNTSCQMIDVMITSIKVLSDDLKVELYPNPASNWFRLSLESNERELFEFVLFNELGQPVLNRKVESIGQYDFDIKELSTGLYYFILKTEKGQLISNGSFLKSNNP